MQVISGSVFGESVWFFPGHWLTGISEQKVDVFQRSIGEYQG